MRSFSDEQRITYFESPSLRIVATFRCIHVSKPTARERPGGKRERSLKQVRPIVRPRGPKDVPPPCRARAHSCERLAWPPLSHSIHFGVTGSNSSESLIVGMRCSL